MGRKHIAREAGAVGSEAVREEAPWVDADGALSTRAGGTQLESYTRGVVVGGGRAHLAV
jgi:hypothetical protein